MKKKLRMTYQREIILQELRNCTTHPTADELYERIKKKLPHISLATVYRNLEILSGSGIVKKIEISGRQKRFDWDVKQHNHIYCLHCQRVDNLELERIPSQIIYPENAKGYVISGCRIEFIGYCPDCQQIKHTKGGNTMGCTKCATDTMSKEQIQVLKALAGSNVPCGSKEISSASGIDAKQVSSQITALKKKGYVASPVRCKYEITSEGKKALA